MPEGPEIKSSVEIFCSYSHQDEALRKEFEASVAGLRRQNLARIWYDRQIPAGKNWAADISEHLNSADIVTLLVSADFLASDYCYEKELRRALERAERNQALVVPIIVRPCDWHDAPFAHFEAIPAGAKAITSWTNRDEAWTDVATSLKITVRRLLTRRLEALERFKKEAERITRKTAVPPVAPVLSEPSSPAQGYFPSPAQDYLDKVHQSHLEAQIVREFIAKVKILNSELGPMRPSPKKTADDAFNNMDGYIRKS